MIIIDGVQYGLDSILNSQQSDVVMQKIKDAFDYLAPAPRTTQSSYRQVFHHSIVAYD